MKLSLRFIIPLILFLSLVAYAVIPLVDTLTLKWFTNDIESRTKLIVSTIEDSLISTLDKPNDGKTQQLFNRVIQDERLFAVGFCNNDHQLIQKSLNFPTEVGCEIASNAIDPNQIYRRVYKVGTGKLHFNFAPIFDGRGRFRGHLVLAHDMSFIDRRTAETKLYVFYFFALLAIVISLITVFIAQISLRGWINGLRAVLTGEMLIKPTSKKLASPEFRPIIKDLRLLLRDLEAERKFGDEARVSWSPKALKNILQKELKGDEVIVVSNREPYIHVNKNGHVEVQTPASGLVTALEPIMRACSGTWIAHGAGNADKETVDAHDRVRVPPDNPTYQIRRVWLSKEEEQGYYYGFANEGLWALCHIAHVRPIFRSSDWAQYYAVNEKFARTVVEEAKTDDPVVLVQDYHLALVPKMIRDRLPKATVITFWHIPFPNPEVFGICPWREELLEGLLGSNILGFHTQFHCNNFMETVDRVLETRIDRETNTVLHGGHSTSINHYPISIEYPVKWMTGQRSIKDSREFIRELNGLPADRLLGVGVDRLDYTKGILERFLAVERLLELEPKWIGKFSFIQIAAPSRSTIEQYQRFDHDVRALAAKINSRFGEPGYDPIILKIEHHEPHQVYEYYRASDVCIVTSLHDGMNLVAKEFIASRDDERGVLVLSQFAGAAKELPEALIVNPYNIDQCAQALDLALEMPITEQRSRMAAMRGLIQEFNIFRWAGRMILDAAKLRQRTRLFDYIREHKYKKRKQLTV